ncbi:hypothetical protein [Metabacillus indicus]|uniref:hypothetical protein n=1 Tax=Metabacillus indicus TaxID=246786 RepID=UPI003CEDDEBE
MLKPDIKNDKLVFQKEIDFQIEDLPSMNFKAGKIEMFSVFHYDVILYEKTDGSMYYLFKAYEDCTLFIMNCNKDIYDILEKFIKITDDVSIFDYDPSNKRSSLEYVIIPEEYRESTNSTGMGALFFK